MVKGKIKPSPIGDSRAELNYKEMIEKAIVGVFQTTAAGRYLKANQALADLLGFDSPEELIQSRTDIPRQEYADPGKRADFLRLIEEKGIVRDFEYEAVRKDGSPIWVSECSRAVRDAGGKLLYYEGTTQDITERKRAEEALRAGEEKYRTIIENIEEGYYEVDLQGNFTSVNDVMARLVDMPKESLIGLNNRAYLEDESAREVYRAFNHVYKTGLPSRIKELGIIRKDGIRWWFELSILLLKDGKGRPAGFRGLVHDITERKKTEQALLETNAQLKVLIQAIPDIVYFKDSDRRNRLSNKALDDAFGLEPGQLIGKKDEEVLPLDLAAACRKSDDIVFESGEPFRFEEKTIGPDGKSIIFETIKAPIFDARGRAAGLVGVSRNITERKQVEDALRESEGRFRSLYENSTVGLYRTTPDGRILIANRALLQMLGYSTLEDLAKINLEKEGFEPSYTRSAFREKIEREGEIRGLETAWKKKDGSTSYVRESARAIRADDDSVLYYEGTVEDITERKKAEDALRASEEKYRRLFENSMDGIYQSLPEGRFITVNRALAQMFGFHDELDMCQADIRDLYLHPEDRKEWARAIRKKGEIRNFEVRLKRKDGIPFVALENSRAFLDGRGNVLYYEGILTDITARKKDEEERMKSEQLYRALFEHANDAVFLMSLDGTHVKVNKRAADMTGYTIEELIGKTVKDLVVPREHSQAQEKLKGLIDGLSFPTYERTFRKKDGTEFHVEINVSPIVDSDQRPRFLQSIVRDISERKVKERALHAAIQEKDLLLKEIHHRVKNNMQVISSLLNLQGRYIKDPQDVEIFKESQRRIRSMALIHEKLYQSRSHSQIEFGGYLRQLTSHMLYSSDKKPGQIGLRLDIEEILFDIQTAIPLGLIINELFSNSLKHAFPGDREGKISLELRRANADELLLTVKDDGIGLPPHFDLRRSESMGMQLVTLLVDQLEGRVEIERRHGAEFKIFFKEAKYKPRV